MAKHIFDVDIAVKYGFACAVILENIRYWIDKNKANEKHFYEGRYWTYNSTKALCELFPYLSKNTIARSLKKLEDEGIIISGNFNTVSYDRTKWYALTDLGECIYPNSEMDLPKFRNGFTQNEKSIYPNSETNTIYNTNSNTDNKKQIIGEFSENGTLNESFEEYRRMRAKIKKPIVTDRTVNMLRNKLEQLAPNNPEKQAAILDQSTFHCWQGVFELKDESFYRKKLPENDSDAFKEEPVLDLWGDD